MSVLYIDCSHHDWNRHGGQLDWAKVRAATSPVMVARATYGDPSGWNRPSYHHADFHNGAKAAGFDVRGSYHNLVRGDSASIARQVDWLRREMDAVGATWAMLDVERYPELVSADMHPRFDDAQQFCDRWRAVDTRPLLVYLPKWIWDGHMGRPDLRTLRCPLVASNYGSNPDGTPSAVYNARGGDAGTGWNAYGGVTPTIWQYGSNIDCPGASGATDVNAFRGSLAELRTLLTGQPQEDDMTREEFIEHFKAALNDPTVTAIMRARPWQYPVRTGASALNVLFAEALPGLTAGQKALGEAIARESSNPDEVKALLAQLPQPQVDSEALAASLAPKLVASLPADSPITDEQLARVLRSVLGSLDASQ